MVENGLKLEEGLEDSLDQARSDGTRIVTATDLVTLRRFDASDTEEIAEHGPGGPPLLDRPADDARAGDRVDARSCATTSASTSRPARTTSPAG